MRSWKEDTPKSRPSGKAWRGERPCMFKARKEVDLDASKQKREGVTWGIEKLVRARSSSGRGKAT